MQHLMVIKPLYEFPLNPHGVSDRERRNYYHFAPRNLEARAGLMLPEITLKFRGRAHCGSQASLPHSAGHDLCFEINTFRRASYTL